jgi:hypothetical protein
MGGVDGSDMDDDLEGTAERLYGVAEADDDAVDDDVPTVVS